MNQNIKKKSAEIKKEIEEIYLNLSHEIKQKIRTEATKRSYKKHLEQKSPLRVCQKI